MKKTVKPKLKALHTTKIKGGPKIQKEELTKFFKALDYAWTNEYGTSREVLLRMRNLVGVALGKTEIEDDSEMDY